MKGFDDAADLQNQTEDACLLSATACPAEIYLLANAWSMQAVCIVT